MPAWTCRRYGAPDVLALEDVPVPAMRPGWVLVRVRATTVSSCDSRIRALRLPSGMGLLGRLALGWNGPRRPVLGAEAAGTVAAVGAGVTAWRVGDEVVAFPDMRMGAHAAFLAMPADGLLIPRPAGLSLGEAASLCFGGMTALDFLRRAALAPGERLLVIGACGTVGSALVQLGRHRGARVTAVASGEGVACAAALGAERVLDRHREDFRRLGERWDVIADTAGATGFRECLPLLGEGGRYLAIAGGLGDMLARNRGNRRSIAGPVRSRLADLQELGRLAEAGAFRPLVDGVHAFADMPAAHARTDGGRKRGSAVVILPAA